MKRLVTCALVIGLVGCGASDARTADKLPPGVHAGTPETENEKAVASFIEHYPKQIGADAEWIEWGPNDEDGTQTTHAKAGKNTLVRVRFSAKTENAPRTVHDEIYLINGEPPLRGIVGHRDNTDGADWITKAKATKKAEQEKALKGPN